MDLLTLSLPWISAVLVGAALIIGIFGVLLTREADRLADATGWGEALMGGVFFGGATSLSGIIASVTAAAGGHADLAVSNALGGIAAQTVLLAVADMAYRGANLEHAASSLANMLHGALLVMLLALPLLAMAGPRACWVFIPRPCCCWQRTSSVCEWFRMFKRGPYGDPRSPPKRVRTKPNQRTDPIRTEMPCG